MASIGFYSGADLTELKVCDAKSLNCFIVLSGNSSLCYCIVDWTVDLQPLLMFSTPPGSCLD